MTSKVQRITEQVEALPEEEMDEFLSWLADYELKHADDWDRQIEQDAEPGGRLDRLLTKVRKDVAEGRTKPLDEILDNS